MLLRADLVELAHDLGGGAAMERALERPDGAHHGARDVRPGGHDDAGRERGGVEAMLRTDHEVGVEGARRRGIGGLAREQVQETGGRRQLRVWGQRLEALAEARERREHGRRERGQLAGLLDRGWPGRLRLGAPHRQAGPQRVHGVRRERQVTECAHDPLRERTAGQVRRCRPLAGPQELGDLGVRPGLHELADGVAAVQQPTRLAIHQRDGGLSRQDARETGRVGARLRLFHALESSPRVRGAWCVWTLGPGRHIEGV